MLLAAAERFGFDMHASWMIGDKLSDQEAAAAAGVGHRCLLAQADGLADITRTLAKVAGE